MILYDGRVRLSGWGSEAATARRRHGTLWLKAVIAGCVANDLLTVEQRMWWMQGWPPPETFPSIGTVENPAIFYDGTHLLLCYEVAPIDGGGNAVVLFGNVIYFEKNSNNLHEGGRYLKYPARSWHFTEVFGSDRTERWNALNPRFWTISFNDVMIEVVFREVLLLHRHPEAIQPQVALLNFLGTWYQSKAIGYKGDDRNMS